MSDISSIIDGVLEDSAKARVKKGRKRPSKKMIAAMSLALIFVLGVSVAYAANILPGSTTTSTSVVSSRAGSTSTLTTTTTPLETSFSTVTAQNTTIIQPVVENFTSSTTTTTITITAATMTQTAFITTYLTGVTITNSTTETISCPHAPLC